MGRRIPSFRQLIEIERLNWSEFKKGLPTKNDKEEYNFIFENATLYTQYLSNANRPIPIEPIMMGALFHNYKTLAELNEESKLSEDSIMQKVVTLERQQPISKMLFDKTCERWSGLSYSLHKDDRESLLRMFFECCNGLSKRGARTVMDTDSKGSTSLLFLFCLVLQNQKLMSRIVKSTEKNVKPGDNLLDLIDRL